MGEKGAGETRWQRAELMIIYALGVVLILALAVLWMRQQGWFSRSPVVVHSPEKLLARPIEINTARAEGLMQIRGIGEARAKDILLLRDNLIRDQKADRKRAKGKGLGWQSLEEFIDAVRVRPGMTPDIVDELRSAVRVEPLTK